MRDVIVGLLIASVFLAMAMYATVADSEEKLTPQQMMQAFHMKCAEYAEVAQQQNPTNPYFPPAIYTACMAAVYESIAVEQMKEYENWEKGTTM